MKLSLNPNELIEAYTFENRHLTIKCNQISTNKFMIDILPRVRYVLNLTEELTSNAFISPMLFFKYGLVVIPYYTDLNNDKVRQICIMNLSDRNVRLHHGQDLFNNVSPTITSKTNTEDDMSNESI